MYNKSIKLIRYLIYPHRNHYCIAQSLCYPHEGLLLWKFRFYCRGQEHCLHNRGHARHAPSLSRIILCQISIYFISSEWQMSRTQPFIMVWWKLLMGHLWWLSKTKTPHCVEVWSSSNVPNSPLSRANLPSFLEHVRITYPPSSLSRSLIYIYQTLTYDV
jgi:hypothetical protein